MCAASILSLKPVQFAVHGAGPFRSGYPALIRFCRLHDEESTARPDYAIADADIPAFPTWTPPDSYDRGRELARLLLVVGRSGVGKSTVLGGIHASFGLLAQSARGSFADEHPSRNERLGKASIPSEAQLDLRATCILDGEPRELILSIWTGGDQPPVDWSTVLAHGDAWGAREWARIGFRAGSSEPLESSDAIGRAILGAIRHAEDAGAYVPAPRHASGGPLVCGLRELPVCLSVGFDGGSLDSSWRSDLEAGRRGGTYRPSRDCPPLADATVGNLLDGMDASRSDAIVDHLTKAVVAPWGRSEKLEFTPAGTMVAVGENGRSLVRQLHEMSRGERALLSLHANVLSRATKATLVLIDDLDATFSAAEMPAFSRSLARLARAMPAVTFVAVVRDLKSAQAFDVWDREPGLGVAVVAVDGFQAQ